MDLRTLSSVVCLVVILCVVEGKPVINPERRIVPRQADNFAFILPRSASSGLGRSIDLPLASYPQASDSFVAGTSNSQVQATGISDHADSNLIAAKLADQRNYGYSLTDALTDSYGNPATPYSLLPENDRQKQQAAAQQRFVNGLPAQGEKTNKDALSFILPSYASGVTKVEKKFNNPLPTSSFGVNKPSEDLLPPRGDPESVDNRKPVIQDPAQFSDYEATVPSFPLVVPTKIPVIVPEYISLDKQSQQPQQPQQSQQPPPQQLSNAGNFGNPQQHPQGIPGLSLQQPGFNNFQSTHQFGASFPQPSNNGFHLSSASTIRPQIQSFQGDGKYTGGFGGPPGVLIPYDNIDTRFGSGRLSAFESF